MNIDIVRAVPGRHDELTLDFRVNRQGVVGLDNAAIVAYHDREDTPTLKLVLRPTEGDLFVQNTDGNVVFEGDVLLLVAELLQLGMYRAAFKDASRKLEEA